MKFIKNKKMFIVIIAAAVIICMIGIFFIVDNANKKAMLLKKQAGIERSQTIRALNEQLRIDESSDTADRHEKIAKDRAAIKKAIKDTRTTN